MVVLLILAIGGTAVDITGQSPNRLLLSHLFRRQT